MTINLYKVKRLESRGPDFIGFINVVLEEKKNEIDTLRSIDQLRRYSEVYSPHVIIIELSEIKKVKKLKVLINKLKALTNGRLILLRRESYYKAQIIYADIRGDILYIYK